MRKLRTPSREDFNRHLPSRNKDERSYAVPKRTVPLEPGQWRMGRIVKFSRGDPVVSCIGNPYVILANCYERGLTVNQRVIYEVKTVLGRYAIGLFKEIF